MAATPIGPGGAPYGIPPPERKIESESGSDSAGEFQRITPDIHRAILESEHSRDSKLTGLSAELTNEVKVFERKLGDLRVLSLEYCDLVCKSDYLESLSQSGSSGEEAAQVGSQKPEDSSDQIARLDQLIEAAKDAMSVYIDDLVKTHQNLGISKEFFSDWWSLERVEEHKREVSLDFMKAQMLNRCLNKICFLKVLQ